MHPAGVLRLTLQAEVPLGTVPAGVVAEGNPSQVQTFVGLLALPFLHMGREGPGVVLGKGTRHQRQAHLFLTGIEIFRMEVERRPEAYDNYRDFMDEWLWRAEDLQKREAFTEPVAPARLSLETALVKTEEDSEDLLFDVKKQLEGLTDYPDVTKLIHACATHTGLAFDLSLRL